MKVLIDSSTIYSAIAHKGKISRILDILIEEHTIVLSDYIIEELKRNFDDKLTKKKKKEAKKRIDEISENCIKKTKEEYIRYIDESKNCISDKDAPILACGMLSDIDYLVTSDKEFFDIENDKVDVISPKETETILL